MRLNYSCFLIKYLYYYFRRWIPVSVSKNKLTYMLYGHCIYHFGKFCYWKTFSNAVCLYTDHLENIYLQLSAQSNFPLEKLPFKVKNIRNRNVFKPNGSNALQDWLSKTQYFIKKQHECLWETWEKSWNPN